MSLMNKSSAFMHRDVNKGGREGVTTRPVAEGGGGAWGGSAPQWEIKLKSCPPNQNLLLPILIIFTEAKNDPAVLLKWL